MNYYGQDPDDNKSYQKTVAMAVAAASLVILLFLVILYLNTDKKSDKSPKPQTVAEETQEDDFLSESHNIKSSELDFWKDAKKKEPVREEEEGEDTPYKDPDKDASDGEDTTDNGSSDKKNKQKDPDSDGVDGKNTDNDDKYSKDEYIAVTDEKGNKKYYEILKELPKNDYDLENNLINENGLLTYKDNKREAIRGVDLSKYNGDVDFGKLKDNGIKFAMLRLGSRGYGTGKITLDEKFVEYAQNAQVAGIQIGAYFYSQAVNETEAVEEANYIVGAVSGFGIKYPIAIDIEKVEGDEARTDKLTTEERTAVVKMFCDAVKGYGYKPVIYATSDMLVAGLDLKELSDYDVWLADYNIPTDYPYRYSMWQYNKKGRIDGITGDIDLNLSFIDYEQK